MRQSIISRLQRIEERFGARAEPKAIVLSLVSPDGTVSKQFISWVGGIGSTVEQRLWVLIVAGRKPALDAERCVQIVREGGFLPTGRFGVVDLSLIPDGLNAKQTEDFLRENGAQTCGGYEKR